jgi:hypothetical protein
MSTHPSDILPRMENRSLSDAGGTPGGLGTFLIGFIMVCLGGYFLANQVSVVGSYWSFYGTSTFGLTLLPMLFGVGLLFWKGRSLIGWLLTVAGALFILAGVIANMHVYFERTSLFHTLVMLILLVGGMGLIARAVQPHVDH